MTEFLICDEVCVNKADMYLDDLTFSILCPGIILEHIFSNLTHQQNCTTSSISSRMFVKLIIILTVKHCFLLFFQKTQVY